METTHNDTHTTGETRTSTSTSAPTPAMPPMDSASSADAAAAVEVDPTTEKEQTAEEQEASRIAKAAKQQKKKDRIKRKKLEQQQATASAAASASGSVTDDATSSSSSSSSVGVDSAILTAELADLESKFASNPMHAVFNPSRGTNLTFSHAKGRHVLSARPLPAGSVVFRIGAYGSVVFDRYVPAFCSRCFHTAPTMLCCGACKHARFCSVKCKNEMAGLHSLECDALGRLQQMGSEGETAPLRMIIRMCFMRQQERLAQQIKEADKGAAALPKPVWHSQPGQSWSEMRSLITHIGQHSTANKSDILLTMVNLQQTVIQDESIWRDPEITPQVMMEMLFAIQCNAHTITDQDKRHVGVGLYLPAAYLSHSCRPTCVYWFDDGEMVLQTVRPVAAGEEITFSYVDLYASRADRAMQLQRIYFIPACQCSRCTKTHEKSSEDALMRSLICSGCGSNPLIDWRQANLTATPPQAGPTTPNTTILKYNKSNNGDMYCGCNKSYSKATLSEFLAVTSQLSDQAQLMAQSGDIADAIDHLNTRILYVTKPIAPGYPFFHPHHATLFNIYLRMLGFLVAADETVDNLIWRVRYTSAVLECLEAQQLITHPTAAEVMQLRANSLYTLFTLQQYRSSDIGKSPLVVHAVSPLIRSASSAAASASAPAASAAPLDLLSSAYGDYSHARTIYTNCYGATHASTKAAAARIAQLEPEYEKHNKKGKHTETNAKGKKK